MSLNETYYTNLHDCARNTSYDHDARYVGTYYNWRMQNFTISVIELGKQYSYDYSKLNPNKIAYKFIPEELPSSPIKTFDLYDEDNTFFGKIEFRNDPNDRKDLDNRLYLCHGIPSGSYPTTRNYYTYNVMPRNRRESALGSLYFENQGTFTESHIFDSSHILTHIALSVIKHIDSETQDLVDKFLYHTVETVSLVSSKITNIFDSTNEVDDEKQKLYSTVCAADKVIVSLNSKITKLQAEIQEFKVQIDALQKVVDKFDTVILKHRKIFNLDCNQKNSLPVQLNDLIAKISKANEELKSSFEVSKTEYEKAASTEKALTDRICNIENQLGRVALFNSKTLLAVNQIQALTNQVEDVQLRDTIQDLCDDVIDMSTDLDEFLNEGT